MAPLVEIEHDSADLFDVQKARNCARYVAGSVRRRRQQVLGIFSVIVIGTLLGVLSLPKTYHAEAKVLAQRNPVLPVRGDQPGTDLPTRAAPETVLRHDNLVALIKQTDLVNHYAAHRALAVRVKDAIFGLFKHEETEEDRIDGMVELLEKRFAVWTNEGTVSIAIDWPDAQMAFRLVDVAQQNFLEARHVAEISAAAESVGILQGHASSLRSDVDTAVDVLKKLREGRNPSAEGASQSGVTARSDPAPVQAGHRPAHPDPDVAKLRVMMEAKERAISDLEEFRRKRLSELQTKLAEQRAIYTENHPTIVDLQQTIASLSTESPQVASLRKEVASLRAELERKNAASADASDEAGEPRPAPVRSVSPPPQLPYDILSLDRDPREERDPALVYARGQLRDAMDKYAALRAQIQTAQIDLETAEAAFKYRYAVITPAQVPKKPSKPNAPLVILASVLAALLVSVVAAVFADVRTGRLVEHWQVEELLNLPILGEVNIPALPRYEQE